MTIKETGTVRASDGRMRKVKWNNQTGEIYLEGKPGVFGGGDMRRIGMVTKNKADAMSYAQGWLESHKDA